MSSEKGSVHIINDCDGKKVVIINDVRFKAKRWDEWDDIKSLLKEYVGREYIIAETADSIFIGPDLPDEYVGSKYTAGLWKASLRAKANASQAIPEMITIASNPNHERNIKDKHKADAKYGWYTYTTRFAIPVYDSTGREIRNYKVFSAELLVRHSSDGKKYLYDLVGINKNGHTPYSY